MYSDGSLECYGRPTRVNGDYWYKVSRFNVCRAFGIDPHSELQLSDEELLAQLKGKEFDCSLLASTFIANSPEPAKENRWTLRDIECKHCGWKVCGCGDSYEPMEAEHV